MLGADGIMAFGVSPEHGVSYKKKGENSGHDMIYGMKRLTITDFARLGGKARDAKLSPERRKQIASAAGKARAAKLSPERRKQIASAAGKKGGRPRARRALNRI
jgi:hypothetical protein